MNWISQLFTDNSVAHAVLILGLVAVCGLAVGQIHIKGIGLGITGVLFAGLVFGHFKLSLSHEVLDFARDFGLMLFVFMVGLQVGPGFLGSLRQRGLALNAMAASIVILGVLTTLLIARLGHIPMAVAVGLFSGGTTNTPSLAAAQQALKDLPGATSDLSQLPGLGYAIAYPFGVIGIILTMLLMRSISGFRSVAEAETAEKPRTEPLRVANLVVANPDLHGASLEKVGAASNGHVVVSRVLHNSAVAVAEPETALAAGDVMLAVGSQEELNQLRTVVGHDSEVDLRTLPSDIRTQWVFVTHSKVLGKTLGELDLAHRHHVSITRISRAEIEFTPHADLRLQFGDALLAVGQEQPLKDMANTLGNAANDLHHPQFVPVFIGLALGILLGSLPITVPGIPVPIKLGLAGGPLLVAILLSSIGRIGPVVWYMPASANAALRELGIILFLACVGLKAGDKFIPTLLQGDGFQWMAWAALITLLPLLAVALFASRVLKTPFPLLCGLLAGSMTDPPALAFANTMAGSDAPSISYATVYPLVMILRIVAAQILVLFFAH